MLTQTEFRQYCRFTHQLPASAIEYISIVRCSPPSRMVGTHAKTNVVSFVPSSKMGHTISTESKGPEGAFATFCRADPQCLEIWDQLEPVPIERYDKNGKLNKGSYTCDFLILTADGPFVVEVKPYSVLEELVKDQPKNWIKEGEKYTYLPAVKAFQKLGLKHLVFVYKTAMQIKVFNLNLLSFYKEMQPLNDLDQRKITSLFETSFFKSMEDIRRELNYENYDSILGAIARNEFFFDIEKELLSDADSVRLVLDKSHVLITNSFNVSKVYEGGRQDAVHVSSQPGFTEVSKVLKRLERIDSGESSRSVRRWNSLIRKGRKNGLSRFESLISGRHRSGNNKRKIAQPVADFLIKFLKESFAPDKGATLYWGHKKYVVNAKEQHPNFDPVSRPTFTAYFKALPAEFVANLRYGRRGANAAAPSSDPHDRNLKAQLAWERAAIDHYLADVYVVVAKDEDEVYVERPWVSAMIDLATGVVLAISLSFKAPSKVSCAKVMRECVRKHGKLPREIIVDRGSDFTSVYFEALLAHYELILSFRPTAQGRYGGEVEGLFKEFKQSWLSQRSGNLNDYKDPRAVDGTHLPSKFAILRIFDLYRELNAFCNFRSGKSINIHIESRKERFLRHQRDFSRLAVHIENDGVFALATAVDILKYTLNPQRGIKINELWYYSSKLREGDIKKSKLDVRIDPENPHVIYVHIRDEWTPLYSSQISSFASKTLDMQLQEGLVALEGANFRRKLREKADEQLVHLIREMNQVASNDQTPIAEVVQDVSKESGLIDLNFQGLKIRTLPMEAWS